MSAGISGASMLFPRLGSCRCAVLPFASGLPHASGALESPAKVDPYRPPSRARRVQGEESKSPRTPLHQRDRESVVDSWSASCGERKWKGIHSPDPGPADTRRGARGRRADSGTTTDPPYLTRPRHHRTIPSCRIDLARPPQIALLIQFRQFAQTHLQSLPRRHAFAGCLFGTLGNVVPGGLALLPTITDVQVRTMLGASALAMTARPSAAAVRFRQRAEYRHFANARWKTDSC